MHLSQLGFALLIPYAQNMRLSPMVVAFMGHVVTLVCLHLRHPAKEATASLTVRLLLAHLQPGWWSFLA
jgi:hypothetical protein